MGRARDLGIQIGTLPTGRWNAITDVGGVRVGHETLIIGHGPLVPGAGPVRTGVTVVVPHDGNPWSEPLFAGGHVLNGNGELTGLPWIQESGLLYGAIAITNTHSVGVVRDRLVDHAVRYRSPGSPSWSLTVVGETYDGRLNDINGHHVRPQHVDAALDAASAGSVAEGGVGGGTGMICHEFKGGIGTSSRVLPAEAGGWTVGVLVQANYGRRGLLTIDGVPVGREIPTTEVPSPYDVPKRIPGEPQPGDGSIIIIVATDAPLLPHQCQRVAQRAGLGLARSGGVGATSSGDLFLCFATGNRGLHPAEVEPDGQTFETVRSMIDDALDPLFEATIEATEESIANALVAAETMVGRDGVIAHELPKDRLVEVMSHYGRIHAANA
ncbi:MAG TPA: P1 family peptidase [Candidatus Polarisedimenticolia bacterium]|nr:P1 family peptidase [Candidatus Polarisedimenticolia bacterium]